ncbi:MAG: hypothetical protein PHT80_02755, partial [Lentisphaeria bacterium]|nr:hypothetical protein [Lentisphaeria bacterium]
IGEDFGFFFDDGSVAGEGDEGLNKFQEQPQEMQDGLIPQAEFAFSAHVGCFFGGRERILDEQETELVGKGAFLAGLLPQALEGKTDQALVCGVPPGDADAVVHFHQGLNVYALRLQWHKVDLPGEKMVWTVSAPVANGHFVLPCCRDAAGGGH